ncbi:LPXTG-site transpeptidase (sortase) family protein [Tumebacillus sp. BK434]|uniref:class D sortase n=1 Tax=Tumebacillus sp. BK434 TaxID=2512169 RepID=UPI0010491A74|nr:class D sortase [Tumebacillus sp. BK434]TCP52738.1 LPXTG-site transpeptidase (sortase) family protein [Tumebacillus sp. BK434]
MRRQRILTICGIVLLLAGVIWTLRIPYYFHRSDAVGGDLLEQARAVVSTAPKEVPQTAPQDAAALQPPARAPQAEPTAPFGVLQIPALKLQAPIVAGTAERQISVAVGHFTGSAAPGTSGTALLAAHNATWFRHLDRLQRGDTVLVSTADGTYSYEVTEARIVHVDDGVTKTRGPGLVLESCYPLDALRQTDYRYLVYATAKKPGA